MVAEPSADLLQHRLLLFTGKGGVGKTTVVAALAVHAAKLGMRPLVMELGHRESMRSVFGVDDIGFSPRDVGQGVHAMSIDIDVALLDYMIQHLPSKRLARSIVHNRVLERLFKAMPAVGEIATINKLRQIEAERTSDGKPRFSPILVDLDATGHAVMFLELRQTLESIVGAGPMRRLIESTAAMLADPAMSRLNLVTTPDDLPVTETIELFAKLQQAGSVAFGRVFVNRVPQVDLGARPEHDLAALETAAEAVGDADLLADARFARQAWLQKERAQVQIERLCDRVPLPVARLPRLPADRMGPDQLAHLGAMAAQAGGES